MTPRVSAKPATADDLLAKFTQRLTRADDFPSILRYKPLPEQDAFHRSQCRNRILFGGNRGGKTYSGTADDILILTRRHPHRNHLYADRPRRIRFIGVDFDRGIAQTALPLFKQFLPPSDLINGSWEDSYRPSERILTLADGSTASFMSYEQDPDKFQAVSLDHIHFDEEPPEPIFKESLARLLDTNGGWTLSETPVQQLEWVFDELIEPAEAGTRPDIGIFYLDVRENTHIAEGAIEELYIGLSEKERTVRLEGRYNRGDSLVFPEFSRKYPYVITREQFWQRFDRTWTVYESMDHGFANPTSWNWTAVHPDGSLVVFKVLYQAGVVVSEWAERVKATRKVIAQKLGMPPSWRPAGTYGDPSIKQRNQAVTGTTIQQEYARHGINIGIEGLVQSRTGNQNVGLDKFHLYLRPRPVDVASAATGGYGEPTLQIVEGDAEALIAELRKLRKPKMSLTQKAEKNTAEEVRDKDNHSFDAQKYLFMMRHDLTVRRTGAEERTPIVEQMRTEFHIVPSPYTTHTHAMRAKLNGSTPWSVDADPYEDLE